MPNGESLILDRARRNAAEAAETNRELVRAADGRESGSYSDLLTGEWLAVQLYGDPATCCLQPDGRWIMAPVGGGGAKDAPIFARSLHMLLVKASRVAYDRGKL